MYKATRVTYESGDRELYIDTRVPSSKIVQETHINLYTEEEIRRARQSAHDRTIAQVLYIIHDMQRRTATSEEEMRLLISLETQINKKVEDIS